LNGDDGLWLIGLDLFAGTGWRAMDLAGLLWPHVAAPDFPHLRDALATGYVAAGGTAPDAAADRLMLCLSLRASLALHPVGPDRGAALARAVALARASPTA